MDAIELLHSRVSCPLLDAPGPTEKQMETLFQAALRAPDHGAIRPWRFLTVSGEGREALGRLFVKAALDDNPQLSDERQHKMRSMPLRAPLVIVVIAAVKEHAKVPAVEQEISAGCAAQNIILAAHAMELGAMWRTGDMAYHPVVKEGLGIGESDSIIGYLYLGTPKKLRKAPQHNLADYVTEWTGR